MATKKIQVDRQTFVKHFHSSRWETDWFNSTDTQKVSKRVKGEVEATLVAVRVDNEIRIGYSKVNPVDNSSKSDGLQRALLRATQGHRHPRRIPHNLRPYYEQFLPLVETRKSFADVRTPRIEDFEFVAGKLHEHAH